MNSTGMQADGSRGAFFLSISELAAYWQFTDSSHFARAFKKRYGQPPSEYARSTGPGEAGRN
jgi:AraC-like DNA-binding protein